MKRARNTWTRAGDLKVVQRKIVRADEENEDEAESGDAIRVGGHGAVFNQPTLIGSVRWGFVEWIEPRAFEPVLEDDVRYLFNHDGMPLARTKNGTLRLSEDKTGLSVDADLAPITLSRDVATLIERGDIDQMSFAFYPGETRVGTIDLKERGKSSLPDGILDEWDGLPYQAITSMERLFDVSAVTYPAYEGTDAVLLGKMMDAEVRSFFDEHPEFRFTPKYDDASRNHRLRELTTKWKV